MENRWPSRFSIMRLFLVHTLTIVLLAIFISPAVADWSIPLSVQSGGRSTNLTFGVEASAGNGYDVGKDSPTAFEGEELAAYFPHPEWGITFAGSTTGMFHRDIRGTLPQDFYFDIKSTSPKATISWNSYLLPPRTNFLLIDALSGVQVDMRNSQSITVGVSPTATRFKITVTEGDTDAPLPPDGVEITEKEKALSITWGVGDEPDLAGYKVHFGRDGEDFERTVDVRKVYNYNLFNLDPETTYSVAVSAYDHEGNESGYSSVVTGRYWKDTEPPAVPSGVKVSASESSLFVSWEANSEDDLAGYKLFCGSQSGIYTVIINLGLATSYQFSTLQSHQEYVIAVTAYDENDNESTYSSEVVAKLLDHTPPSAPTELQANQSDGAVALTWALGSEPDLAGYSLYWEDDSGQGGGPFNVGLQNHYTLTTLQAGDTYTFWLLASDKEGNESPSSPRVTIVVAEETEPGTGVDPGNPTEPEDAQIVDQTEDGNNTVDNPASGQGSDPAGDDDQTPPEVAVPETDEEPDGDASGDIAEAGTPGSGGSQVDSGDGPNNFTGESDQSQWVNTDNSSSSNSQTAGNTTRRTGTAIYNLTDLFGQDEPKKTQTSTKNNTSDDGRWRQQQNRPEKPPEDDSEKPRVKKKPLAPPANIEIVIEDGQPLLAWERADDKSIQGYRLRVGLTPDNLEHDIDLGDTTLFLLNGGDQKQIFYLTLESYGRKGRSVASAPLKFEWDPRQVSLLNSFQLTIEQNGWQSVAIPLEISGRVLNLFFQTLGVKPEDAFAWQATSAKFAPVQSILPGQGIYLNATEGVFDIFGRSASVEVSAIDLVKGWNFVGNPAKSDLRYETLRYRAGEKNLNLDEAGRKQILTLPFQDLLENAYHPIDVGKKPVWKAGKGCWIHAKQPCQLVLPSTTTQQPVKKVASVPAAGAKPAHKTVKTDVSNK